MQGVVFLGDRQLELQEFPDPDPGPGQVVVRMRAAGLCGSDLNSYRLSAEELAERTSVICGHEPCGVVEEVGAGTRNLRRGDRVPWSITIAVVASAATARPAGTNCVRMA